MRTRSFNRKQYISQKRLRLDNDYPNLTANRSQTKRLQAKLLQRNSGQKSFRIVKRTMKIMILQMIIWCIQRTSWTCFPPWPIITLWWILSMSTESVIWLSKFSTLSMIMRTAAATHDAGPLTVTTSLSSSPSSFGARGKEIWTPPQSSAIRLISSARRYNGYETWKSWSK